MLINTFTMQEEKKASLFTAAYFAISNGQHTFAFNLLMEFPRRADWITFRNEMHTVMPWKCYRWHSVIIKFVPLNAGSEHEERPKSKALLIRLISIIRNTWNVQCDNLPSKVSWCLIELYAFLLHVVVVFSLSFGFFSHHVEWPRLAKLSVSYMTCFFCLFLARIVDNEFALLDAVRC